MFFQSSIGIHIENSQVTLVLLKMSFKGVQLVASEVRPVDGNMPIKEKVKKIAEQVSEFLRRYGVHRPYIHLGIPRKSVILRNISLPLAVKENLRGSLSYEMEKYVPFAADDVYFDYLLLKEDKKESKIEILLAVARRDDVRPYFELTDLLGTGISGIEIGSSAIVNCLFDTHSKQAGQSYRLVYMAEDYFEIDGVKEGRLSYSRVFGFEATHHTLVDEIVKGLEQIQKSFGQRSNSLGVVLCGQAASETLYNGLKEKGISIQDIDLSEGNILSQGLIPAFGIGLKGLKSVPNRLNFLPKEMRRRPGKSPFYLMIVLGMLALLCAVGWWGGGVFQQRLFMKNLDREVERLRSEVVKTEEIQKKSEKIGKELDELVSFTAVGRPMLDILKELTIRVPENAWLNEFNLFKGEAIISGFADTASELIPLLEESPLFRDVVFLSTITKTKEGKEQFRIGFKVE